MKEPLLDQLVENSLSLQFVESWIFRYAGMGTILCIFGAIKSGKNTIADSLMEKFPQYGKKINISKDDSDKKIASTLKDVAKGALKGRGQILIQGNKDFLCEALKIWKIDIPVKKMLVFCPLGLVLDTIENLNIVAQVSGDEDGFVDPLIALEQYFRLFMVNNNCSRVFEVMTYDELQEYFKTAFEFTSRNQKLSDAWQDFTKKLGIQVCDLKYCVTSSLKIDVMQHYPLVVNNELNKEEAPELWCCFMDKINQLLLLGSYELEDLGI